MPFISDAASAIKSRFGFHDRVGEAVSSVRSTPDLLKSATKENFSQASAIRNIRDWDDDDDGGVGGATVVTASSNQSFEICEDPSFWKDHNVQVVKWFTGLKYGFNCFWNLNLMLIRSCFVLFCSFFLVFFFWWCYYWIFVVLF